MLLTGKRKETITIETPKGIPFTADILQITRSETKVSCAVEKDGGDDPDITTGALIFASVSLGRANGQKEVVVIDGGKGVGRVQKPGLDQPIGNAAINHVPREMITREVMQVCELVDYQGKLEVIISVPNGEELAEKTFNPRLGIVGGISILGTSGIVEPMSNQAVLDTIRVELNQRKEQGFSYVAVAPGNYGLDFMKKTYGYDLDRSVKCSNFIGATVDMAVELGFERMLLTGHIGKLIKLAGGIMNTHSHSADARMEVLASNAIRAGASLECAKEILNASTTDEAIDILEKYQILQKTMKEILDRIQFYLNHRSYEQILLGAVIFNNTYGYLGQTADAEKLIKLINAQNDEAQ